MNNEFFSCNHISEADLEDISSFTISAGTAYGLVRYLQVGAYQDEIENLARTYIVRDVISYEIVGYFTVKAGNVTAFSEVKSIKDVFAREFDSVSGVELANFAVNDSYKKKHPYMQHIGAIIFHDFILPICVEAAKYVGARLIYIFALPYKSLLKYYKEILGFERLDPIREVKTHKRIKPRYDKNCIFMYQVLV